MCYWIGLISQFWPHANIWPMSCASSPNKYIRTDSTLPLHLGPKHFAPVFSDTIYVWHVKSCSCHSPVYPGLQKHSPVDDIQKPLLWHWHSLEQFCPNLPSGHGWPHTVPCTQKPQRCLSYEELIQLNSVLWFNSLKSESCLLSLQIRTKSLIYFSVTIFFF